MSGFMFWEWVLAALVPTAISLYAAWLARNANIIARNANTIADRSDKKMTAIANLDFDEKLARMAQYLDEIHGITSNFKKMGIGAEADEFLNTIRSIKNDFSAVSNLKEYASIDKKEELITRYIIPILKDLHQLKNLYLHANMPISSEWDVLFEEIKKIAIDYNIDAQTLRSI